MAARARMHADEVEVEEPLVRRLLHAQMPQWADLRLDPVASVGTGHALFRLGDDMAVRLPLMGSSAAQVGKEHAWLPVLAPHLPLDVPVPLAKGHPEDAYPWHWSVYRWLEGDNALDVPFADPHDAARRLGGFVAAMQGVDATGGPAPGAHNFYRGVPLAERDESARAGIAALRETYDSRVLTAIWEEALAAPPYDGPPVWVHADLQAGNLLVSEGRLTAVIDFGGLGVGDPACDVMTAWTLLTAETRETFRDALPPVDEATWTRARGWALSVGVIALPYYRDTNAVAAAIARHAVEEVLADAGNATASRAV